MKSYQLVLACLLCIGFGGVLQVVASPQMRAGNWVCTARSLAGKRFSATGTNKTLTQEAAMQKCEAQSFRCYPTGCKGG